MKIEICIKNSVIKASAMIETNQFDNQITNLIDDIKKLDKIRNSWKLDNDI